MSETRGRVLVLCSGGIDSTTLAYYLHDVGNHVDLLNIDYGQRSAVMERQHASLTALSLVGTMMHCLDIPELGRLLSSSALTNRNLEIPSGQYTQESLKITIVPNRNAILTNIAVGVAAAREYDLVALGVHAGDHPVYPDCRPRFLTTLRELAFVALEGKGPAIIAPFIRMEKAEILEKGHKLQVPFENTYSCYRGERIQCGICSTCTERRKAFKVIGVEDPTRYQNE